MYFVLDLNKRKKDIRRLVKILEDSVVEFLNNYKIIARPDKKNIGIWVKNKKISAIGIRVSKWVAYHGCSINITNDLNQYKKIVPCGLNNKMVTSIKSLGIKPSYINKNLKRIFYKNLSKV